VALQVYQIILSLYCS